MRNSIVYFCLLVCCITVRAEELKLWYSHPAEEWVEALPLGNSRLGAMIYGNPFEEEIQLNEETVWEAVHIGMIIRKLTAFCPKCESLFLQEERLPQKSYGKNMLLPNRMGCLIKLSVV